MATYHWVGGSGPVTFNLAAGWSTTDGGAGGSGPPASADNVVVARGSPQFGGADLSAIVLASLVCSASGVTWGSAGTAFKIGFASASAVVCSFTGDYGDTYFSPVCAGTGCIVQFLGSGNVWLTGATAQGTFLVGGGRVSVGATFTNSTPGNWSIVSVGGVVSVDAGTSNAIVVDVQDGVLYSARNINSGSVAGRLFLTGTATNAATTVYPLGLYCHQSSGTITLITLKTGAVASDAGAMAPFTVTNATGYGAVKLFTRGNPLITYTNQPMLIGGTPPEGPA